MEAAREFFAFPWTGVAGFMTVLGLLFVVVRVGWQRFKDWADLPAKVDALGRKLDSYVETHAQEAQQWRQEYLNHTEHPPRGTK